jgi:hypothetical protein
MKIRTFAWLYSLPHFTIFCNQSSRYYTKFVMPFKVQAVLNSLHFKIKVHHKEKGRLQTTYKNCKVPGALLKKCKRVWLLSKFKRLKNKSIYPEKQSLWDRIKLESIFDFKKLILNLPCYCRTREIWAIWLA